MKSSGIKGVGLVGLVAGSKSESFRRLNSHLLTPNPAAPAPLPDSPQSNRLRQRTGPKLNKTETLFQEWLHGQYDPKEIRAQAVTLLIGNGVRYTVDFTNLMLGLAWETKGFMRDDAAVKIKVAASLYPEIKFHLVTRQKNAIGVAWDIQEILP